MNTLPNNPPNKAPLEPNSLAGDHARGLPDFLLSAVMPYRVTLTNQAAEQTQPHKTQAELLADGQCEV